MQKALKCPAAIIQWKCNLRQRIINHKGANHEKK